MGTKSWQNDTKEVPLKKDPNKIIPEKAPAKNQPIPNADPDKNNPRNPKEDMT
jgi:hypothetical protein